MPEPRHLRFHDVRHTTATLLLKVGVDLSIVQRVLRHRDPSTTPQICRHLDVKDMRAAVNKLTLKNAASDNSPSPATAMAAKAKEGQPPGAQLISQLAQALAALLKQTPQA